MRLLTRLTLATLLAASPMLALAEEEVTGDPDVTITQNVGLINLANRFKLLYNGRARILLSSSQNPRETTVMLTIPLEVQSHV